jgi:hypothetical protein
LGKTISVISDCESLTGRGSSISSLIVLFPFVMIEPCMTGLEA